VLALARYSRYGRSGAVHELTRYVAHVVLRAGIYRVLDRVHGVWLVVIIVVAVAYLLGHRRRRS
jgi:hypothetical protein